MLLLFICCVISISWGIVFCHKPVWVRFVRVGLTLRSFYLHLAFILISVKHFNLEHAS
jgi:hypothetical protein